MSEGALDRVLRLAGGTTRSYVRSNQQGRPVQVRQYPTPHPAAPNATGPQANAPQAQALPKGQQAFGSLRRGQLIVLARQQYIVVQANVPASGPGSGFPSGSAFTTGSGTNTGSGVQTSSGVNTGSQGQGVNAAPNNPQAAAQAAAAAALFGTPRQNPQLAAMKGKQIPTGTPTVTNLLSNTANHWLWFTTLPASFAVQVVLGLRGARRAGGAPGLPRPGLYLRFLRHDYARRRLRRL